MGTLTTIPGAETGLLLKGTRCLGSVELVFGKRLKPFDIQCIDGLIDNSKAEYNDPHKFALKLRGFPFTLRTNSQPFMGVKYLTPINGCGSLYSTFKLSIKPYAFYNNRLQTLLKDQLDRSTTHQNIGSNVQNLLGSWKMAGMTIHINQ